MCILHIDGIDRLADLSLDPLWEPSLHTTYAGAVGEADGKGGVLWHILNRVLGWLPVSTFQGQDPLLPPHVRVILSHNCSSERLTCVLHKYLMLHGTSRVLRAIPSDERKTIFGILQAMNVRTGGHVPDSALSTLLPPVGLMAAGKEGMLGNSSSDSRSISSPKVSVGVETLWLALAMKRLELCKTRVISLPEPFAEADAERNREKLKQAATVCDLLPPNNPPP